MAKIQKIVERAYCGVRFALMLDKRHSGNTYPVAVRITHNYRQRYFMHGDRTTEEEFSKVAAVGKGTKYEKRREWERFFDFIYEDVKKRIDGGDFILPSYRVGAGTETGVTINTLFKERIESLYENGKINTGDMYSTVLKRIASKFGDVPVESVDSEFVKSFMKSISGLSKTTQSIYLRNLRAVCNYAIYKGVMKKSSYPFSSNRYDNNRMRIPAGATRSERYLNIEQMRMLYGYDGEYSKEVFLFLFSYLANGINLADMAMLRYDMHWRRSEGREFGFVRRKTKDTSSRETVIHIPVTQWLNNVMEKLCCRPERGTLLFPWLLDGCDTPRREAVRLDDWSKRIRKGLAHACSELGIEEHVTMTWARHSYKTNLIRQRVPDHYCEQMMGHVDASVGGHYVGMFTEEDRMRYNSMLL